MEACVCLKSIGSPAHLSVNTCVAPSKKRRWGASFGDINCSWLSAIVGLASQYICIPAVAESPSLVHVRIGLMILDAVLVLDNIHTAKCLASSPASQLKRGLWGGFPALIPSSDGARCRSLHYEPDVGCRKSASLLPHPTDALLSLWVFTISPESVRKSKQSWGCLHVSGHTWSTYLILLRCLRSLWKTTIKSLWALRSLWTPSTYLGRSKFCHQSCSRFAKGQSLGLQVHSPGASSNAIIRT